eukprot:CAMPEP_0181113172 /NCGR_PEP_ID=MMETSP1071-20121207/20207_1 /TAXON_ID=35127 /ORGANISM="Thalassiosira sp., Strain NH16" /LENGTH=43 /DNA_ID= /DNA_START= /DNA_END= /DNA_ORIENTATION=
MVDVRREGTEEAESQAGADISRRTTEQLRADEKKEKTGGEGDK